MKFWRILSFVISVLVSTSLGSCTDSPENDILVDIPLVTPTISHQKSTSIINQNWVIFSAADAEEKKIASWLVGNNSYWSPSENDILTLEEKLPEYLRQNAYLFIHQPPVWERLDQYQRQYVGIDRGGQKIIYGNYFCNNLNINWSEKIVSVEDGGDCYFQIKYDVEGGTFIFLLVNGES